MYCILDEKETIHNAAKGVPRSIRVDGKNICVKNMEIYKKTLFPDSKKDAKLVGEFSRINNRGMKISTMQQEKTMFTALDNKRYVCEDNIHTLAWGHYSIPEEENQKYVDINKPVKSTSSDFHNKKQSISPSELVCTPQEFYQMVLLSLNG